MIVHRDIDQGTDAWLALRCGKPTASNFSKLTTSTGERSKTLDAYALTLAGEKYTGKQLDSFEGNGWTDRGKLLEEDARKMYSFLNDTLLEQVGFVTDDDDLYGCSPDALVSDDGLMEIKVLKPENHIKALLYIKKHNKCPPDYVQQTQGQIFICERNWCDLVFYHPELPSKIIRQERNEEIIKSLKTHLAIVIAERDRVLMELKP